MMLLTVVKHTTAEVFSNSSVPTKCPHDEDVLINKHGYYSTQ